MPSRNLEKAYVEEAYYHIYNRGVESRPIFQDKQDYVFFLSLFKRYLSKKPCQDKQGREYPNYHKKINLLAYCLMPTHFHILVYQKDKEAITDLLRGLCTAYTMYFNRRNRRNGHLFQNRFKASLINEDSYLLHISRYVHLNPDNYYEWEFSSLPYYLGANQAEWIDPQRILELFKGESYLMFLSDYLGHRAVLKEIKESLADM